MQPRILLLSGLLSVCLVRALAQATAPSPGEEQRERTQRAAEIFEALDIKEGSAVADVGAGTGFFAVRLAKLVGKSGRVYAEDINEEHAIKRLRERVEKDRLDNLTVILGAPDDPKLPHSALDAALMVDAYHEMDKYPEILQHVLAALKPGGRLVMVDIMPRKTRNTPRAAQVKNHVLAPELAEAEIRQAGFEIISRRDDFVDRPDEEQGYWMIVARRPFP